MTCPVITQRLRGAPPYPARGDAAAGAQTVTRMPPAAGVTIRQFGVSQDSDAHTGESAEAHALRQSGRRRRSPGTWIRTARRSGRTCQVSGCPGKRTSTGLDQFAAFAEYCRIRHLDVIAVAWCIPVSPAEPGYGKPFHATAPARLTDGDCNGTPRKGPVVTPAIGTCSCGAERYSTRSSRLYHAVSPEGPALRGTVTEPCRKIPAGGEARWRGR